MLLNSNKWFEDGECNWNKSFRHNAIELVVNPSFLSRWIAGVGPLTDIDVSILTTNLSTVVYPFLSLAHSVIYEILSEDVNEQNQRSPSP
jgi:hypothetical protein